jgi:hypothetical protein
MKTTKGTSTFIINILEERAALNSAKQVKW